VSTRWARAALCTLAVTTAALAGSAGTGAAAQARQVHESEFRAQRSNPPLTLVSQTPWVTPAQPWFNIVFGVSPSAAAASGLHVNVTFYGRLVDGSALQQAENGSPAGSVLLRDDDIAVGAVSGGLGATSCVTVLPEDSTSPPAGGPCPAGAPTLVLGCTPLNGTCPGVYPVTVSLFRQGSSSPLSRFTTFLTYNESEGQSLRVGLVVPVKPGGLTAMAGALAGHRDVATTLAVCPAAVAGAQQTHDHAAVRAQDQIDALVGDEVIGAPYVPVNLAALAGANLTGEINAQVSRGDELLHSAGLKPVDGSWVDASTPFTQGDASSLASGLQVAGAPQLVLSDNDLASGGVSNLTFAQPFSLDLGHGSTIPAAAVDSSLSARFNQEPSNPVLAAEQLLAGVSFVHFEAPFLADARGVVLVPPSSWRPSETFMNTLLGGLQNNPSLQAVTLSQFFAQVPAGGNHEPSVRRLQSGPAGPGITHNAADRIALARDQLASFSKAVSGHPPEMNSLGDTLLSTEARGLSATRRADALTAYDRAFASETDKITLATERTVTFTAQRAAIPVTVLSAAPYPVSVVVTLASDKFTFPDGNTRQLVLNRPTTSVRVTAQARTSGDRLPIEVTLQTPNGQLTLAHTVLTVHSTAISFAGVALTVLAGAVLLAWWVRTWRRSRRQRPRAQH
jgi:hypothetical protein